MQDLMNMMGRRSWVQLLNLSVFSIGFAAFFSLALPLRTMPSRQVDLADDLPSTRTLGPTEIVGFAAAEHSAAIETTPESWLVDRHGLGEDFRPNRRYLVPLEPNLAAAEAADPKDCLLTISIVTDGDLEEALKDLGGAVRGRLRRPHRFIWLFDHQKEVDAANELAASSGHDRVLIMDRLNGSLAPQWLLLAMFGYLALTAAAMYQRASIPKPLYIAIAFLLVIFGGYVWWIAPELSPMSAAVESLLTPAMVCAGVAMLIAAGTLETTSRLRKNALHEFRFDSEAQHDDQQLFVGPDHLRVSSDAGEAMIFDKDVQSITWLHILSYVDNQTVKGYFTTILRHETADGHSAETTIKTDFEDPRIEYDPALDRLADYRFRVADLRAGVLAEQLARNGKAEGDGWSIDREQVRIKPPAGKPISFPRRDFQDGCFVGEEFTIHQAGSDLPLRIESYARDLLIFGRVLKTLVTEQSTAALDGRAEGRVLARFTSSRLLLTKRSLPRWAMISLGYAFIIVPLSLARWIGSNFPEPVAGISPEYWFLAAVLLYAITVAYLRKRSTRHLDLCENGLRLTQRRVGRFIPWESMSNARLDRRRMTGHGQYESTALTVSFIAKDRDQGEPITFTWDTAIAGAGEVTALERFLATVSE